jgi:hypothetical protein
MRKKEWDDDFVKTDTSMADRQSIRMRRTCYIIAIGSLFYALWKKDIPVVFLSVSFLLIEAAAMLVELQNKRVAALSKFLRAFGITLFVGSVLLLIFR